MAEHIYLCIDLKSFYASVECVERGFDPMTTNLVVADMSRSEKTICLAVTPAMKALGIRNRCRVFEIPKNVEYIAAPPRMQHYINYSAEIYAVYLQYVSKDDIHVYSIDECFLDVTNYLSLYKKTTKELAMCIMDDILKKTGVRATCGIGTNLYLTKIALDITAKHSPDFIGELDEESYKKTLWQHRPLTDFWRVGAGTAKRLEKYGIFTMGQIARMSVQNEDLLYRLFGIDAELLIDHAWGREPVTIADIKAYKPQTKSITSGQVLMRDYEFDEGELIVKEMTELLALDLTDKELVTRSVTLHVGYSNALKLKSAHGTTALETDTNSMRELVPAVADLYRHIVNPKYPIRRVNISCNRVTPEISRQYSLFDDPEEIERERKLQGAVNEIKKKFGKGAIIKGMNLQQGATTIERNHQIGGHKSGD